MPHPSRSFAKDGTRHGLGKNRRDAACDVYGFLMSSDKLKGQTGAEAQSRFAFNGRLKPPSATVVRTFFSDLKNPQRSSLLLLIKAELLVKAGLPFLAATD